MPSGLQPYVCQSPLSSTLFYSLLLSSLLCASQAERARRVIDALASDDELREHGGDFTL